MKVAVIGASGFVGSTLVEQLVKRGTAIAACIHGSGSAGRIARLGIPLISLDLLDVDTVKRTLQGCTHVVNCSRGSDEVMLKGLNNLLQASRAMAVKRLVHLSSVAVYGDPPSADSVSEDGRTQPARGTYGWIKLEQDKIVAEAASAGLPSIVLCPPNISGVQSIYLQMILDALRQGRFALLDHGTAPCNMVDVRNLSHAIELALASGPGDGQRLFVTDDRPTTWAEVIERLRFLAGKDIEIPEIEREDLIRLNTPAPPRVSLLKSVVHLMSSDVRQALRKDPLWARVDAVVRGSVRALGGAMEDKLRLAVEGPAPVARASRAPALSVQLCAQQLRGVVHSCERAKRLLGYRPLHTFEQSMAAFDRWYRASHGWNTPAAQLLKAM